MQRLFCPLLCLALAAAVPATAGASGSAGQSPLKLELQLAADDWLLENDANSAMALSALPARSRLSDPGLDRSGRGFRVGAIVPSLCEDDLPGNDVLDAYNRVMTCDEDKLGVAISIRNY
ncbi:hypothetical protein [Aquisalimonas sp.]|uniref:hypothetical protein n=1 Tax=Aquisalimonas sp. TaxID=1872621 RepID=UPI0025C6BD18|nr:hypothetical protein [Aquisalimonas sp.]